MRKSLIKKLDIPKELFLCSKIDGKTYKDVGNFSKHLIKHNLTIESYTIKYHNDLLPDCLISGDKSDWKLKGYWDRWFCLKKEFKKSYTKLLLIENKINKVKNTPYYSEYLSLDYWEGRMSMEKYIELMYFLFNTDTSYYKRLCYNWYEHDGYRHYTREFIDRYIQSLLDMHPIKPPHGQSVESFMEMGNSEEKSVELFNVWRANFNSSFKRSDIQKHNNELKLKKYSKLELRRFNTRCVEYWLSRGYSLLESIDKISKLQQTNTVESISFRYKCSTKEARDIQISLYNKRKTTFSEKSKEELERIYKSQDAGSMEYCLKKCDYDLKIAENLYKKLLISRTIPFGHASRESLKYFIPLYKFLRRIGIRREDIYFGIGGNKEYFIYDTNLKKIKFYDFTIRSKKLMIEYDGVYWHKNSSADDSYKDDLAIRSGFKILRVKSDDKCIFEKINNFIYETLQIKNTDW